MGADSKQFTDSYIKKLLKDQFKRWDEPDKELESWMIDVKRQQLRIERLLKQARKR